MRARMLGLLLLGLAPAACVTPPSPVTLSAPGISISFGLDPDMWAINMAQWAFADPARTANRPVEAARAAAAIEYLAVALDGFRWHALNPIVQPEMRQARAELRQALGILPDAPTQPVIDALLASAQALSVGHQEQAHAALRNPFFTFPAEQSLAVLTNMPYLRMANVASMHVGMGDPMGHAGSPMQERLWRP